MLPVRQRRVRVYQHVVLERICGVLRNMHVGANEVSIDLEREVREGCDKWDLVRDDVVSIHRRAGEGQGDKMFGIPSYQGVVGRIVPCPVEHFGDVDCAGSIPSMNGAPRAALPLGPLAGRREGKYRICGRVSNGIVDRDVDEFGGDRDDWKEKAW